MLDCSHALYKREPWCKPASHHLSSSSTIDIDKATTYHLCCLAHDRTFNFVHKQQAARSPLQRKLSLSAMASRSALMALLVVVSSVAAVSAATSFTVGDSSGWSLGVNYDNWASGKSFADGDQLVFNFATGSHDVVEVDKSGYDGCSTSSATNTIQNGPATVTLTSGTHYYICGIAGHCSGGMKLAVTVASGSGSSPSAPPTAGGSPSTPTTPSAPSPAGTPASASVRLTAGPALAVAAAVLVKLALF